MCSRAASIAKTAADGERDEVLHLADYFCAFAKLHIERNFDGLRHNTDRSGYKLAQTALKNSVKPLEEGIVLSSRASNY
jgi:hypothetical protein